MLVCVVQQSADGHSSRPAAPYPTHGGQPPSPSAVIRLTIQGSKFSTNIVTPTVTLNGLLVPSQYGTQDYTVLPGVTRVEIFSSWYRQYGQAEADVSLAPGNMVELYYAVPWHQFTRGALGTVKQKRPGLLPFVLVMTAIPLAVLLPFFL